MLSVETRRRNRESVREGSYGRFLYNFYRTYDPNTGRYLEADPLRSAALEVPGDMSSLASGHLNTYTYAWNSPVMLIDPLGADPSNPNAFMSSSTTAAFKRNAKAINKALRALQPPPGAAISGCNLAFGACILDAADSSRNYATCEDVRRSCVSGLPPGWAICFHDPKKNPHPGGAPFPSPYGE